MPAKKRQQGQGKIGDFLKKVKKTLKFKHIKWATIASILGMTIYQVKKAYDNIQEDPLNNYGSVQNEIIDVILAVQGREELVDRNIPPNDPTLFPPQLQPPPSYRQATSLLGTGIGSKIKAILKGTLNLAKAGAILGMSALTAKTMWEHIKRNSHHSYGDLGDDLIDVLFKLSGESATAEWARKEMRDTFKGTGASCKCDKSKVKRGALRGHKRRGITL